MKKLLFVLAAAISLFMASAFDGHGAITASCTDPAVTVTSISPATLAPGTNAVAAFTATCGSSVKVRWNRDSASGTIIKNSTSYTCSLSVGCSNNDPYTVVNGDSQHNICATATVFSGTLSSSNTRCAFVGSAPPPPPPPPPPPLDHLYAALNGATSVSMSIHDPRVAFMGVEPQPRASRCQGMDWTISGAVTNPAGVYQTMTQAQQIGVDGVSATPNPPSFDGTFNMTRFLKWPGDGFCANGVKNIGFSHSFAGGSDYPKRLHGALRSDGALLYGSGEIQLAQLWLLGNYGCPTAPGGAGDPCDWIEAGVFVGQDACGRWWNTPTSYIELLKNKNSQTFNTPYNCTDQFHYYQHSQGSYDFYITGIWHYGDTITQNIETN